jgi:ankyrin repeat protein
MLYNTIADIESLAGKQEDDEFDIKRDIIATAELARIILSFANGNKETGYIIIGLDETRGNSDESQNHKVNTSTKYPIQFPKKIKTNKSDKEANAFNCNTFDEYVGRLKTYLKNNIYANPAITDVNELLEIIKIPVIENEVEGCLIVIKINQHHSRPIQFMSDHKFYMRYPETAHGKGDACSKDMNAEQLFQETKKKYYRVKSAAPVYSDSKPAVPELTALFDFIYYDDLPNVEKLLEELPTLTQMSDSAGNNALHVAACYGRENIFDLLTKKHKMSLFQSNKDGRNVLLQAAYGGKINFVKMLIPIDSGLLRQRDRSGNDVYLISSHYNQIDLIQYFLESHRYDFLNTRNNSGWNVLQVAAYSAALNSFTILINLVAWTKEDLEKTLEIAKSYRRTPETDIENRHLKYDEIIKNLDEKLSAPKSNKLTNVGNSTASAHTMLNSNQSFIGGSKETQKVEPCTKNEFKSGLN